MSYCQRIASFARVAVGSSRAGWKCGLARRHHALCAVWYTLLEASYPLSQSHKRSSYCACIVLSVSLLMRKVANHVASIPVGFFDACRGSRGNSLVDTYHTDELPRCLVKIFRMLRIVYQRLMKVFQRLVNLVSGVKEGAKGGVKEGVLGKPSA